MHKTYAITSLLVGIFACTAGLGCGDEGTAGDDAATATTGGSEDGTDDTGAGMDEAGIDTGMDTGTEESSDGGAQSSSGGTAGDSSGGTATCETDICATYGAAVPDVASDIVDRAAADPQFMEDFAPLVEAGPDAVDEFKTSLANFISDAYGCSEGAYTGPSMEESHEGLDITQEEYDAFIGLIAGVLMDAGVPEEDIGACFAPPLVDPEFANTIIGQ